MFTIAKGKELKLTKNEKNVTENAKLILEEEVTISLSSSFSPIVEKDTKVLNFIGGAARTIFGKGFSGQFKQFGIQTWQSTDPISLNITVSFHIGDQGIWDAKTEVILPAQQLCKLPLPSLNGSNLIGPGPTVLTAFGVREKDVSYNPISLSVAQYLNIPQILVKKAEPTFSSDVDESGYPIWAKVNLDIISVEVATQEMFDTARLLKEVSTQEFNASRNRLSNTGAIE